MNRKAILLAIPLLLTACARNDTKSALISTIEDRDQAQRKLNEEAAKSATAFNDAHKAERDKLAADQAELTKQVALDPRYRDRMAQDQAAAAKLDAAAKAAKDDLQKKIGVIAQTVDDDNKRISVYSELICEQQGHKAWEKYQYNAATQKCEKEQ